MVRKMIRGLFCDFYGTVVHENGPRSYEVIKRVFKNGNAESPEQVVEAWWKSFGKLLSESHGDNYRTQYEAAYECFEKLLKHFQAQDDPKELCDMMVEHWSHPPIYEETVEFLQQIQKMQIPLYFVTNSDDRFVEEAMKHYGLQSQGLITSEQARCYKTRKDIFLYALDKTGLDPEEVIHIGDSLNGDVKFAMEAGIRPIWLNREGKEVPENVRAVTSLLEVVELFKSEI